MNDNYTECIKRWLRQRAGLDYDPVIGSEYWMGPTAGGTCGEGTCDYDGDPAEFTVYFKNPYEDQPIAREYTIKVGDEWTADITFGALIKEITNA